MSAVRMALWIGLLGMALWLLLAALGQQVMPSYLAAWLFWMALPLGALPLVMLLELFDDRGWTLLPVLRRLLPLLPIGALFAIPVMIAVSPLYHHAGLTERLPGWWIAPRFLLARMIVLLLVWSALALMFRRPSPHGPRRGLAIIGLLLHFVMGSLAALDWVMSLDAGIGSSAFGLLVILAQIGTALCAAVLILAITANEGRLPNEVAPMMAGVLGAWMFLHFIQYLVVWSANLPGEVTWYQTRALGLGAPTVGSVFAAGALALAVLLSHRLARLPAVIASLAVMLLLAHALEMLWLVTPPFRGRFTAALSDPAALLGLGGLAVFTLFALSARGKIHARA